MSYKTKIIHLWDKRDVAVKNISVRLSLVENLCKKISLIHICFKAARINTFKVTLNRSSALFSYNLTWSSCSHREPKTFLSLCHYTWSIWQLWNSMLHFSPCPHTVLSLKSTFISMNKVFLNFRQEQVELSFQCWNINCVKLTEQKWNYTNSHLLPCKLRQKNINQSAETFLPACFSDLSKDQIFQCNTSLAPVFKVFLHVLSLACSGII